MGNNDINTTALTGRLTRDSEYQQLQNGTALLKFSIAVNKSFKGKDGQKTEKVSYFDCTVWGNFATAISQYMKKGTAVAVSGELQQNRWQDNEGKKGKSPKDED